MNNANNTIVGIATHNVRAGDMVSIDTQGRFVTVQSPTWSNYAGSPVRDIENAMYNIRYGVPGVPVCYCSACGNEAGKKLVSKHVCVYQHDPYSGLYPGGTKITCVTLNFCAPECEVMWCLKNAEWLQEGLHGQGYKLSNDKQIKDFSCPVNRHNPYAGYLKCGCPNEEAHCYGYTDCTAPYTIISGDRNISTTTDPYPPHHNNATCKIEDISIQKEE